MQKVWWRTFVCRRDWLALRSANARSRTLDSGREEHFPGGNSNGWNKTMTLPYYNNITIRTPLFRSAGEVRRGREGVEGARWDNNITGSVFMLIPREWRTCAPTTIFRGEIERHVACIVESLRRWAEPLRRKGPQHNNIYIYIVYTHVCVFDALRPRRRLASTYIYHYVDLSLSAIRYLPRGGFRGRREDRHGARTSSPRLCSYI